LLPTGNVLVAGGGTFRTASPTASTFLYDPSNNTWSSAGDMAHSRKGHTATLLPNSQVLAAGGTSFRLNSSAELYDPFRGTWSQAGRLAKARVYHTATLLPSGKVLFTGGQGNSGPLSSAELYDPSQTAQTR
jgi:N-acetylneuraminic acid mutarotase